MRPLVNQDIGSYRNLGKRRRRAAPIWRKIFSTRTYGPFIAGLIVFGAIYLCYVFPLNGCLAIIEKKFMDTSVSLGFSLQNVFVEGRKNTQVEEILYNMQVKKGMPILNLDTDAILKNIKNLVLIIIPRHVERVNKISRELSKFKLKQHIHSHTKKINPNTKIYIVDTYGETSLFFKFSKIVFMGKSLTIDGGQNPLDAARENCTIVHGSKISNFLEIYNFLDKQKISFNTKNSNQLYKKVKFLFENHKKKLKIKDKINKIGNEILYKNLKEIESLL